MLIHSRQHFKANFDIFKFVAFVFAFVGGRHSYHVVTGLSVLPFVRHHHILQHYYQNIASEKSSALLVSNAELPRINGAPNGSTIPVPTINITALEDEDELPLSPPLTFDKFTKMQVSIIHCAFWTFL
jgi:hypothetical protein